MPKELKCLTTSSFQKAIVHVDMDSFFASCEQQRDPKLRNRPICIGKERGIATSMSIEAKIAGVTRGMKIADIQRICPECVILPSDYETFGLYSTRMFDIVRRYSDCVEEYSVDECFADITSMRRVLNMTYEEIITAIKHDIDVKLGTICSVGLAPTKTLAKVASKWKKPNGITIISGKRAQYFLNELPVGKVWGIGPKTEQFLVGKGVKTALDFAYKSEGWITEHFTKPHYETWLELRGRAIKTLQTEPVDEYHTISKCKTITPAINDKELLFAHLCKRIENACRKARKFNLVATRFYFGIKSQNFIHKGVELEVSFPTADPITFIETLRPYFDEIFDRDIFYRTTVFALIDLKENPSQLDLFGTSVTSIKRNEIYETIDKINEKYGKHALHLGTTQLALIGGDHQGDRGGQPWRKKEENWLPNETIRRRVNIPFCGFVK